MPDPDLTTEQAALAAQAEILGPQLAIPAQLVTLASRATRGRAETPVPELHLAVLRRRLGPGKMVRRVTPETRARAEMPVRGPQRATPETQAQVAVPARLEIPARPVTQVLLDRLCLPRHIPG